MKRIKKIKNRFPLITNQLSSYINSLQSLEEARCFILSIYSFFNKENTAAQRSLNAIQNSIVLRLARSLRTFVIDPSNQENIELFISIVNWSECMDVNTISSILEGEFFNQWLFVLYSWIHQDHVNYTEIINWIEGWRSLFPKSLLENPFIIKQFNRGWDIVNDVLEKTDKVNPAYFEKPTSYLQVLQNRKKMENAEILKQV